MVTEEPLDELGARATAGADEYAEVIEELTPGCLLRCLVVACLLAGLEDQGGLGDDELASGFVAGEPTFVPAAGSDPRSDEGWLMFYLHDENREKTEFVILDANNFANDPVARVKLPQRVPYGFHGSWIPDSAG